MSARIFCDCCKEEITSKNQQRTSGLIPTAAVQRLSGQHPNAYLIFEVTWGKLDPMSKGVNFNSGDWCKYCIIDAITSLDDRPKVGPA